MNPKCRIEFNVNFCGVLKVEELSNRNLPTHVGSDCDLGVIKRAGIIIKPLSDELSILISPPALLLKVALFVSPPPLYLRWLNRYLCHIRKRAGIIIRSPSAVELSMLFLRPDCVNSCKG
jgi:hypothetical protein